MHFTVRRALVDPFFFRGLIVDPKLYVQAFNLFDDPLVKRFLDGEPCENEAKQQLEIIREIEDATAATPWGRSIASWKAIKSEAEANVRAALCAMGPPA